LTWRGILGSLWWSKARAVAVMLICLLSAIITPPDVVSQIMVALPMIALFQLGILLSMLVEKLKKPVVDNDDDENNEE
ncbi:MAG: twin-arginine translocase subunit TatC, partial [Lachnospiraceae bacterium]|nr:twin-arginine translocase subunit TatC [Lachnospiraceae bacterium]